MNRRALTSTFLGLYLVVLFAYLIGPLIIMSITAFNSPGFPKAAPFECLTFEWFDVLANDERIIRSLRNSFIVGAGTVSLSVALGLAGALMLTQLWPRLRSTYYTVVIAPILIPGVVLGISTLVFWGRLNTWLGLPDDGFLRNGIFLTILGQSTFIASYCMLVFIARLQRFDPGLTEAALDLGATHAQAFRKILLPFLKPAFGSAAVIAFLASFENYNTTTFTFGTFPTLTIELAQKVRYGINPSISALAFIIVVLTVLGALIHETSRRRQQLAIANGAPASAMAGLGLPRLLRNNPAGIALVVLLASIIATLAFAQVYDPSSCKANVRAEKQRIIQERIRKLREQRRKQQLEEQIKGPDIFAPKSGQPAGRATAPQSPGKGTFGDVFNPGNLNEVGPGGKTKTPGGSQAPQSPGKGTFGDVFDPGNLNKVAPGEKKSP